MKIVILGAGQVGLTIAENLASNNANDVTLVDTNAKLLETIQDKLDIQTIVGHASHPDVLEQANAGDADMILAVTDSDETNIVACQVAYTLFNTPQKVARVRHFAYLSRAELFADENAPVDLLISPENMVTEFIYKLIELPGTQQVMDFANNLVQVIAVKAHTGGSMVGHEIQEIRDHIPDVDTRIIAIFRHGRPIAILPNTTIREDDLVYFVAASEHTPTVMQEMRRKDRPYKRIMIAGGGNIGMLLAKKLEKDYQVKLIERDQDRALLLTEYLDDTIVLVGDVADKELLLEENIESTDAFIALTSADDANILSSILAKRLGAHKVMTLVNRPSYVNLVESNTIDVAISPKQVTVSTLLARLKSNNVVSAYALKNTTSEIIETTVHPKNDAIVNKTIDKMKLPETVSIVAIVRENEVIITHHNTKILAGDTLIIIILDQKNNSVIESLFYKEFND